MIAHKPRLAPSYLAIATVLGLACAAVPARADDAAAAQPQPQDRAQAAAIVEDDVHNR